MPRPKGSLNKSTKEVKELAGKYTDKAFKILVKIMEDSDSPSASRVAAAKEIFDRAYGKPAQAVDLSGSVDLGLAKILSEIDGRSKGLPE